MRLLIPPPFLSLPRHTIVLSLVLRCCQVADPFSHIFIARHQRRSLGASCLLSGSIITAVEGHELGSKRCRGVSGEEKNVKWKERWRSGGKLDLSESFAIFMRSRIVTHFSNASVLPGCARLSADALSRRHEWARIQFCT